MERTNHADAQIFNICYENNFCLTFHEIEKIQFFLFYTKKNIHSVEKLEHILDYNSFFYLFDKYINKYVYIFLNI